MKKIVLFPSVCLLLLFLTMPNFGFSQTPTFNVFFITGTPQIVMDGQKSVAILEEAIDPTASVVIDESSYLVLLSNDDLPLGISNPGEYSYPQLITMYNEMKESDVVDEFFGYITDNMIEEEGANRRSGGVYRASGYIMEMPFDSAIVVEEVIPFRWKNESDAAMYFKIYDLKTWECLYNIPTETTTLKLDNKEGKLKQGHSYAWVVTKSKGDPTGATALYVFTMQDQAGLNIVHQQVEKIETNTNNQNLSRIKTIRYFLSNNFYPLPQL